MTDLLLINHVVHRGQSDNIFQHYSALVFGSADQPEKIPPKDYVVGKMMDQFCCTNKKRCMLRMDSGFLNDGSPRFIFVFFRMMIMLGCVVKDPAPYLYKYMKRVQIKRYSQTDRYANQFGILVSYLN